MASAEAVAAVISAGGAHVPELMERLEARLHALARSHGAVLAEHAGSTIAAGGKRLRPLLVFVAAGPEPRDTDGVLRAQLAGRLEQRGGLQRAAMQVALDGYTRVPGVLALQQLPLGERGARA